MKQYQGGHDETWGGVRINIDRNYLDLGPRLRGRPRDPLRRRPHQLLALPPPSTRRDGQARSSALQCLLKEKGAVRRPALRRYDDATVAAANAWKSARGFPVQPRFAPRHWVALLSEGAKPVLKIGSAGPDVRRLQRALSAADPQAHVTATGVFDATTDAALRAWQERNGLTVTGVAAPNTWQKLWKGTR